MHLHRRSRPFFPAMAFLILLAAVFASGMARAETVLTVLPDSGVKVLDPIWTTTYTARTHGFLVYDTLFGLDDKFQVQPQMVDHYTLSPDNLTYTFILRHGLLWHDGTPVTARDCVASLRRWAARDSLGHKLMAATAKLETVDDKSFRLTLGQPFTQVLEALAKLTPPVPFMMKEEQARTDPETQITTVIGSGPFKFVPELFEPDKRAVYVKNPTYRPRPEPAANTSGGKVAKVDRVELVWIPTEPDALKALVSGQIDYMQSPTVAMRPTLQSTPGVKLASIDRLGNMGVLRLNHRQPPFDRVEARRAVLLAIDQEEALTTALGPDRQYAKTCYSLYGCESPYASEVGAENLKKPALEEAKRLLKASGYQGQPIVFLASSDDPLIAAQCKVAARNLERVGFKVDLQSMPWQTLVGRRALDQPAEKGGWHIFITWFYGADLWNPLENIAVGAGCGSAWFGWPCDQELERLRTELSTVTSPARRRELAQAIQKRAYEIVTFVPMGTHVDQVAYRDDRLKGLINGPAQVFWNVTKK